MIMLHNIYSWPIIANLEFIFHLIIVKKESNGEGDTGGSVIR